MKKDQAFFKKKKEVLNEVTDMEREIINSWYTEKMTKRQVRLTFFK